MIELSRLVPVPLREVWKHEALEFTPWLARLDNIALLAGALSLNEIEVNADDA